MVRDKALFGELRSLLARPPGGELFDRLVARLLRTGEVSEEVFEYLHGHVSRWPEGVTRAVPKAWGKVMISTGQMPKGVALCNTWEVGQKVRESAMHKLSELPLDLHTVSFARCKLGRGELERLSRADWLSKVKHLDLSFNKINGHSLRLLSEGNLGKLSSLSLANNRLPVGTWSVLAASTKFRGVEHVDLSANKFADDDFVTFTNLVGDRLKSLNIAGNQITADGLRVWAHSSSFEAAHTLDVSGNQVHNDGLEVLLSTRWRVLSAANCGLTEVAGVLFGMSEDLEEYEVLDLSDNALGSDGVVALTESVGFYSLKRLVLRNVEMGWVGADALANMSSLKNVDVLDLSENRIGTRGVDALRHGYMLPAHIRNQWMKMKSHEIPRDDHDDYYWYQ